MTTDKQRKTGVLSLAERAKITEMAPNFTAEEIANVINRTPERVKRFIEENALTSRDMSEGEIVRTQIRNSLFTKHFWKEVEKQFSADPDELEYFVNTWVELVYSFKEDIKTAEELQLKQLITVDILANRCMIMRNEHMASLKKLERTANEMSSKPDCDKTQLAMIEQQIGIAMQAQTAFTQEYTRLQEKQSRLSQDLKATRADRIKVVQDSKGSWASLMRRFGEVEEREKEGRYLELQKMAADKAREKLQEYHIYEDGDGDYPLLNSETVIDE